MSLLLWMPLIKTKSPTFKLGHIELEVKRERIPKEIQELAKEREKYREQKDWQKADQIRKQIEKMGYQIEDTKQGPKIR